MNSAKIWKLGTRGSPLAMAQALEVRKRLCDFYDWDEARVEIVVMKTTGDRFTDRPLSAIGGKGLFTKELEEGLYSGAIDFAQHSTKDVATILPTGLKLAAILPREDVRDAFVSLKYQSIEDLPFGAVIGTSSLRRRAQILQKRPDLEVIEFRGAVGTRLEKLRAGQAEASFLAVAGLKRLGNEGMLGDLAFPVPTNVMLPAVAQGAVSLEIRENDHEMAELLAPLHHDETAFAVDAERAMLRKLDGSCRTPIAGFFDGVRLWGQVLSLDGAQVLDYVEAFEPNHQEPQTLGEAVADQLLQMGAADVLG